MKKLNVSDLIVDDRVIYSYITIEDTIVLTIVIKPNKADSYYFDIYRILQGFNCTYSENKLYVTIS